MPIPKVIYQTYKTTKLPLIFRWHIRQLKKKNPNYAYRFYDDDDVASFIREEYGEEIFNLYKRINIGAAKADFFRYAILYKKGGIYLDIDSRILQKIDDFIQESDAAVISYEQTKNYFVQYALFFEAGHPFLGRAIEIAISNLKNNKYPYDTHKMTGPTVLTEAIKGCIESNSEISYRMMGPDYENKVEFSFLGSKSALYGLFKKKHWKQAGKSVPVIQQ